VKFVPPAGSPLEIADAIYEAATLILPPATRMPLPTWDAVIEKTLDLYEAAMLARPGPSGARAGGSGAARVFAHRRART
jgi:hypothetical protein